MGNHLVPLAVAVRLRRGDLHKFARPREVVCVAKAEDQLARRTHRYSKVMGPNQAIHAVLTAATACSWCAAERWAHAVGQAVVQRRAAIRICAEAPGWLKAGSDVRSFLEHAVRVALLGAFCAAGVEVGDQNVAGAHVVVPAAEIVLPGRDSFDLGRYQAAASWPVR